jgi:hypothetical protein
VRGTKIADARVVWYFVYASMRFFLRAASWKVASRCGLVAELAERGLKVGHRRMAPPRVVRDGGEAVC